MTAVILCGGKGTRANEVVQLQNKCLLQLNSNTRLIDYSLENAFQCADTVVVLTGWQKESVRDYVDFYIKNHHITKKYHFCDQKTQSGICDALLCCEEAINGDDFMLFLGDEFISNPNHADMLTLYNKLYKPLAIVGFVYVDERESESIKETYSLSIEQNGLVTQITEKPQKIINHIKGTGNCIFNNQFLNLIKSQEGIKNNLSFTEALKNQPNVYGFEIGKKYLNFNRKEDLDAFVLEN